MNLEDLKMTVRRGRNGSTSSSYDDDEDDHNFFNETSCKIISVPTTDLTALYSESKYNTYVFHFKAVTFKNHWNVSQKKR